jgi:hypothetical protein
MKKIEIGKNWALSSVGSERFLDMEKATGSNPVAPTIKFFPDKGKLNGTQASVARR